MLDTTPRQDVQPICFRIHSFLGEVPSEDVSKREGESGKSGANAVFVASRWLATLILPVMPSI